MVERLDAFSHVLPEPFFREMADRYPTTELTNFEDPRFWSIERRLEDMAAYGIDRQVIMLALPPIWRGLDPDEALPLLRLANDEVARIAAEHPDSFVPVGTVPFLGGAYVDELDRCVEDLGMAGVQIFSNVDGRPLGVDSQRPFFRRVADHDVPIWLHPQLHDWYPWIDEYELHRILGWPFDTSVALARLVLGGYLAEYDLDVVAHHMGGMIPHFAGRIATFYRARIQDPEIYPDMGWEVFDEPLETQFQQLYADTAIGGSVPSLGTGLEFFGADRLVFGTDYPFGPDEGRTFIEQNLAAIDRLDLSERDETRVFAGNARALLDTE